MQSFDVAATTVIFETKPDLFSPKRLDIGTKLLLEALVLPSVAAVLPTPESINVLDWGCGWGAISLWAAKHWPAASVTALDSDIAAVATATANAESNGLTNIKIIASHGFDQLEETTFDLILSNPPTHRGREVVENMIAGSHARLSNDGVLLIVVEARLKPWVARQMKEVFGNYKIAKRGPKNVVLIAKK